MSSAGAACSTASVPLSSTVSSSGVALLFVGVTVAQMKRVRMTLRGVGLALFSLLIQPLVVLNGPIGRRLQ
jgi:hypothetical protein